MFNTEPFDVEFEEDDSFDVEFEEDDTFDVEFGEIQSSGGGVPYQGAYDATPTGEEQHFSTQGKTMLRDFVVHAIPRNYGLITYNGFELTVS